MEFDSDSIAGVKLDADAFDAAIFAAEAAAVAGFDNHDTLEHAVKAYVLGMMTKRRPMTIPGAPAPCANPSSGWLDNYADWHERYGKRWTEMEPV